MLTVVQIINICLAAFAAAFAIVAAFKPAVLPPHRPDPGPYPVVHAARAVGLTLVAVPALLDAPSALASIAAVGLAVGQLGDVGVAVRVRHPGLLAGASAAALIHLVSAALLW